MCNSEAQMRPELGFPVSQACSVATTIHTRTCSSCVVQALEIAQCLIFAAEYQTDPKAFGELKLSRILYSQG